MFSTRFNENILRASRKLQERRTVATAAGDVSGSRYTSALLQDYQNHAIRRLLLERMSALGVERFAAAIPEYVSTTPELTLTGESTPIPADCWLVESVWSAGKRFYRVPEASIARVKAGADPLIVPSADESYFFQEGGLIHFLPALASAKVFVRYVRAHVDLVVTESPSDLGFVNIAPGTYTAATKVFTVTLNHALTSADVNSPFLFYDGTTVYSGFILSVASGGVFVGAGDMLPAVDKAVTTILIASTTPGDIVLADSFDPQIVALMVEAAREDFVHNP